MTEPHGSLFDSELLSNLSELITRLNSYRFQAAHASRLSNEFDFTSNRVLYLLGTEGASRPSVLAAQLTTGRSNISKVLKRLESDGLIVSSVDPADSRATVVSLTEKGVAFSHEVFTIGDDMMGELTAEWSAEEAEQFSALLARLNAAAAAYENRLSSAMKQRPRRKNTADD
ncbi:MAG: MarR family transcriptional regulator [Subtercola sp.]|nr:MarR family transcriptional regulator [Subtercola sp.]